MELVSVDGVVFEVEASGSGETVLLLHGAIFADGMRPLADHPLIRDGFKVIDYRRRGYGRSSSPGRGCSMRTHALDAEALLRTLHVDPHIW